MPDKVYVLHMHGHPLMPCTPRKARLLLQAGKAKVAKRTPFTIRLLYDTPSNVQPVILGVDAGSKTVGLSASTETEELFAAELLPRNDVVDLLSTRREFRRARRNRTTRHRQPRFDNRVHSKHIGWLAPSVEVKIQEHITAVKRVCAILPVSKVVVETAEFDLQLLKAIELGLPVPQGEDYQKGEMLGEYNVRQYVLHRDGYTCRCCGARANKHKTIRFHVHHLESRKVGGNAPDNLITLCATCHERLHKGILTKADILAVGMRRRRSTKDAAFMGIMRKTLLLRLRSELDIPVWETHGYVTKYTREQVFKLPKTHINDALCIAQGGCGFNAKGGKISRTARQYTMRPVRHHNRMLHKATIGKGGYRKANQAPRVVHGFRLFDKVRYKTTECYIFGRRSSGSMLLRNIDGTLVKDGVNYKKLILLERSTNYLIS